MYVLIYSSTSTTTNTTNYEVPFLNTFTFTYNSVVIVRCRALFTKANGGNFDVNAFKLRTYNIISSFVDPSTGQSGNCKNNMATPSLVPL